MDKFEELLTKGVPIGEYRDIGKYSMWRGWNSFIEEGNKCQEVMKNRKPIVDFRVRYAINKIF